MNGDAKKMHAYILEYMDLGVHDMPNVPHNFNRWLANKRQLSEEGKLKIVVNHFDYFVI